MEYLDYQVAGANFLISKTRALLADDMGLGKTAQVIKAIEMLYGGKEVYVLVVCPASVRSGWKREISKFHRHLPNVSAVFAAEDLGGVSPGFTVLSYDIAVRDEVLEELKKIRWDIIVLDEVHFLKNKEAKRTRAIFGKGCRAGEDALIYNVDYVWGLSGTPMPNNVSELFPIIKAFGYWAGNYWQFVKEFCTTKDNGFGVQITGARNAGKLKDLLANFMIRRKNMVEKLPVIYEEMPIDPVGHIHPEDFQLWNIAENGSEGIFLRKYLEKAEGKEDDDAYEKGLSKLHIASLRKHTGMAKMKALAAQVSRELDSGKMKKVLIFGIHRDVVELLRCELLRHGALLIYGGTNPKNRDLRLYEFKNYASARVLICNISAAGVGIDGLQECCKDIIFIESSWVPAENAQAVGRLDRMGQKEQVRVRFAYLENSLDEKIQKAIRRKTQMISQIFD